MIKTTAVSVLALSVALSVAGLNFEAPLTIQSAFAGEAAAKKTVSAKLGKQFQDAQAFIQQKKFKEALAKIEELKAAQGKTAYETFVISQLSYAAYNGTQQYGLAAAAAAAMVESPETPANQKQVLAKGVAQNYFLAKNYPKFSEESASYQKQYGADLDLQNL